MLSVTLRPDPFGFWYLISTSECSRYRFTYIAICTGGHYLFGEIMGEATIDSSWKYKELNRSVINAAIEKLDVVSIGQDFLTTASKASPHAHGPDQHTLETRSVEPALSQETLYMLKNLDRSIEFIPVANNSRNSQLLFSEEEDPYYPYYPYGSS